MDAWFVPAKYTALARAFRPNWEKASAWVGEHRQLLTWTTSASALLVLAWKIQGQDVWHVFGESQITQIWALVLALALAPLNLVLEVIKWQQLKTAFGVLPSRWKEAWMEVSVGQTLALIGPFRWADGAGRLMASADAKMTTRRGTHAYAIGAAAQGWATWTGAIPALLLVDWPSAAALVGLGSCAVGWVLSRQPGGTSVMALSLLRFVVFVLQYLGMLCAWNAIEPHRLWVDGYPRIAAVWCAVNTIPWPAELGVRECVATWVFDSHLPAVVMATFALWMLNRVGFALVGLCHWPKLWRPRSKS